MKDIANRLNLSRTTVSHVLNKKADYYGVSKKTRKLVQKAAKEMNYKPHELARNLRLKESKTIGMIVPDVTIFSMVYGVIHQEAIKNGYQVIFCDSRYDVQQEKKYLELLNRRRVDGIIVRPAGNAKKHILKYFDNGIPIIILNKEYKNINIDSVQIDNFKSSYMAVKYLIEKGHKRIAFVHRFPVKYVYPLRLKGYKAALKDFKIPVNESYIMREDSIKESVYKFTKNLLNQPNPPTAFVASSYDGTVDLYTTLLEMGYMIPRDVSLVAIIPVKNGTHITDSVTSVFLPFEDLGIASIELLFKRIKNPEMSYKKKVIEAQLLIRNSVKSINNHKKNK